MEQTLKGICPISASSANVYRLRQRLTQCSDGEESKGQAKPPSSQHSKAPLFGLSPLAWALLPFTGSLETSLADGKWGG